MKNVSLPIPVKKGFLCSIPKSGVGIDLVKPPLHSYGGAAFSFVLVFCLF